MLKAKSFLEVIFVWMLKNRILSLAIFSLIIATSAYLGHMEIQDKKNLEIYTVESSNLQEVVALTGTVKPTEEAELSFEKSGIVKTIEVKVGDKVEIGQKLATLSSADDEAKVSEAQANLSAARALLSDLQTGARSETVDIKKSNLEKSESDIEQAYKNAGDSIRNLSISGNAYIRDSFANYFDGGVQYGYRVVNINSCDALAEGRLATLRGDAEKSLIHIEQISEKFSFLSIDDKDKSLNEVKNVLAPTISEYFSALKDVFSLNCISTNAAYDTVRTLVSTSRNSWSTLSTDLSTKLNIIKTSVVAKTQAQSDLSISETGEKLDKVRQQQAQVKAAEARLQTAKVNKDKNILLAPFVGIITNIDLKKGELVNLGTSGISLISDANFQIESRVSEVDVAKLKNGAKAEVHFDAYGGDQKFEALVSNISQAGIISEGVPTYKTIFDFINKDERIRSGMTANILVVTNTKENVVSVPAKFILNNGGQKYVNVANVDDSSDFQQKNIKTGSYGMNGEVEIVEGLSDSEVIVIEK